jgi:hypothetical protein
VIRPCDNTVSIDLYVDGLLVTSASTTVASEQTVAGRLFHTHRKEKYQIVIWPIHNLTYALVSEVTLPGMQPRGVCDAGTQEENSISTLESSEKAQHRPNKPKLEVIGNAGSASAYCAFRSETHHLTGGTESQRIHHCRPADNKFGGNDEKTPVAQNWQSAQSWTSRASSL